jgi:hypothetical protein
LLSDFESMLIETTAAKILTQVLESFSSVISAELYVDNFNTRYQKTAAIFENLELLSNFEESPKFVFAHILEPYNPNTFSQADELMSSGEDMEKDYINTIQNLNTNLLSIVKSILSDSENPPIIIIQSDHGWPLTPSESRMPILNAFYLPSQQDVGLYDHVTSVNTFRLIFNAFLGTNFEILDDISMYSTNPDQNFDNFQIVPNKCVID